jgi:serine/threonine protein kinase
MARLARAHTTGGGYRVDRLVARGKTASRFDVMHPDSKGPLSMKVFTDESALGQAEAIVARARAVSVLRGPHIARVLDAGTLETGEPFVVTESLIGTDLATLVRCGSPLSIADAVRYTRQVCRGIAEAHAAGVVHGDLDLRHVVIVPDASGAPYARIIDFVGPRAETPTPAEDVRAIGCMLHALATGRAPSETMILPRALDQVVRSCVEGDFPSAMQLFAALTAFAAEAPGARAKLAPTVHVRNRPKSTPIGPLSIVLLAALGPVAAFIAMTIVTLAYADEAPPKPNAAVHHR